MTPKTFNVTLRVWRQVGPGQAGRFVEYPARGVNPDMSFLEMLDVVNDELRRGARSRSRSPTTAARGSAGRARSRSTASRTGPNHGVATCQTYMRSFRDGDRIVVEPFRARAFPVIKDLVTDRSAFDGSSRRAASSRRGRARRPRPTRPGAEGRRRPRDGRRPVHRLRRLRRRLQELERDALRRGEGLPPRAAPQGQPERDRRVLAMVSTMDGLGFGGCTNQYECSAACPKLISHDFIARMNRDYAKAVFRLGVQGAVFSWQRILAILAGDYGRSREPLRVPAPVIALNLPRPAMGESRIAA
jgi:succinate dehydrogenase / fumarate reductase iron-sulfur subunit